MFFYWVHLDMTTSCATVPTKNQENCDVSPCIIIDRYSTTPLGTALYLVCSFLPDRLIEAFAYYGPLGPGKVPGIGFD